jgi:DNA repair protein RadC
MNVKKVTTYMNEDSFPYLVAEETPYKVDGRAKHDDATKIWELTKAMHMTDRVAEMVMLFIFDNAFHLIAVNEVSTGANDRSIVPIREIAQTVLLSNGCQCILAHNHPSGDTTPSDMDISITKRLKDALEILGIKLCDHLVVGRYGYTSMVEQKLM